MSRHNITIKSLYTRTFEVEMLQDMYGRYQIRFKKLDREKFSEWISDFSTASYMFDLKIKELEGQ
jgi:ABC-type iron transport system FetAB ATPase subunit